MTFVEPHLEHFTASSFGEDLAGGFSGALAGSFGVIFSGGLAGMVAADLAGGFSGGVMMVFTPYLECLKTKLAVADASA